MTATDASFTASWTSATVDEDLRRWIAFLADHGITWSPTVQDRDFVDRAMRALPGRAGEGIEIRLSKLANDVLKASGDPRCVAKEVVSGARTWHVLSPEQRKTLAQSGRRFDTGAEGALRQLATIPITLGVYFAANYACTSAGIDRNIAWVIALVAYVLTVRVVRGRWPLQRG